MYLNLHAQTTVSETEESSDSLTLQEVISRVVTKYPSVQQAEEAVRISEMQIDLAKSGYLPGLRGTATYSYVYPVPSFNVPPFGNIELYPKNNFSAALNLNQTILDFGKTGSSVKLAEQNKNLSEARLDIVRQSLSIQTITTYYSLVYIQHALLINSEDLRTLKELVSYVEKKKSAGTATNYELITTRVKLQSAESQRIGLKSQWKARLSVLSSLTDSVFPESITFAEDLLTWKNLADENELLKQALSNRPEMILSKEQQEAAQLQYEVIKRQINPGISAFAQAGGKNGYPVDVNQVKFNYTAGLSLNVPIYEGHMEKHQLAIAKAGINNTVYSTALTKSSITNEVVENLANLQADEQEIKQYETQLEMSQEAFSLAKTNYMAGTITNLDLLDSETNLSASRLLLLKARINYAIDVYKLRLSIGESLY